jgi:ribosomal protein L6P/L9E
MGKLFFGTRTEINNMIKGIRTIWSTVLALNGMRLESYELREITTKERRKGFGNCIIPMASNFRS